MDIYTISQVAEQTGFTPSALRFYEEQGLVTPGRTAAGYRTYGETQVATLRFVARVKRLGLSLDEIGELVELLDQERCAPVQHRLRDLLARRIEATQGRIAELVAFTAELRCVDEMLVGRPVDGPCDDACGCRSDVDAPERRAAVVPVAGPSEAAPPVACTLAPERVDDRIAAWQAVADQAVRRDQTDGGILLTFGESIDVAALARLVAAEQTCCPFFRFVLDVGAEGVALAVTGPDEAGPVIEALVGSAP